MFRFKVVLRVCLLLLLVALSLSSGGGTAWAQASSQDARYFSQTGYRIDNDAVWDYFEARGGVSTFGYPVSRTFLFRGFPVQIFQRHVIQVTGDQARPVNLLDPGLLPVTHVGGLTLPPYNSQVAEAAPPPDTPNYGAAVRQYLEATVPNRWEGQPVGFLDYYLSSAPPQAAGPDILLALEVWGFPTSGPMRDPNNHNFIYTRFQRGIMHYDATTGVTRGILLGDAFKSLLTGRNLPPDLAGEVAGSPFLNLYAPDQPSGLARTVESVDPPVTPQNTDLDRAFEPVGSPSTPEPPTFTRVQVYLIAEGQGNIGCGDAVVPVERQVAPTQQPLSAALQELLSIKERQLGESGLTTALYQSDLRVEEIDLQNRKATIRLAGDLRLGGVCDTPRVEAQLEQTALQFDTVDRVEILINGTPVERIGAEGPSVAITPNSGPPGTPVQVMVTLFPPDTPVRIGIGRQATEPTDLRTARTDAAGTVRTEMRVPLSATPGEPWVVVVSTTEGPNVTATSNVYEVTGQSAVPRTYVVQPGDTLTAIAQRFGTTVRAILDANPSIADPNRISAGQTLVIP